MTATLYGVASALTLDEFALWFDLQDDYWTQAGRKSIDAVALFSSLLTAGVAVAAPCTSSRMRSGAQSPDTLRAPVHDEDGPRRVSPPPGWEALT